MRALLLLSLLFPTTVAAQAPNQSATPLPTTSILATNPATVFADAVIDQNSAQFSDGTPYLSAGPAYFADGEFIDDQTLACMSNPLKCSATLLLNTIAKWNANYSPTLGYPIALPQNLNAPIYFSAWDYYQHVSTGDGRIMLPETLYLYCQAVGFTSASCGAAYTQSQANIKASWALVPRSTTTNLFQVFPGAEYICGQAFMEYMRLTGAVANCNVWYAIDAANMAVIAAAQGDASNAAFWSTQNASVAAAIRANLIDTAAGTAGLLLAATLQNSRNDDIGTSALAAFCDNSPSMASCGVLTSGQKTAIETNVNANYSTLVNASGYILETPQPGGWATVGYLTPTGGPPYNPTSFASTQYQGGFWTWQLPWFGWALAQANQPQEQKLLNTLLAANTATEYYDQGNATPQGTTPNLESPQGAVLLNLLYPALTISGSPVTLTATVSPSTLPGSGPPTGTVTFYNGTAVAGTGTLANGTATLTLNTLPIGTNSLTCTYGGSTLYAASTCNTVSQLINPGFTLSLSPATITLPAGGAASVTIQLASVGGFAGPLTLTYGPPPANVVASLAPATVTLPAGGTAASSLTLNSLLKASATIPTRPALRTLPLPLFAFTLLLVPFGLRRRTKFSRLLFSALFLLALPAIDGCGNTTSTPNTTPGTYQLVITATDSNHNPQTASLTLIVAP